MTHTYIHIIRKLRCKIICPLLRHSAITFPMTLLCRIIMVLYVFHFSTCMVFSSNSLAFLWDPSQRHPRAHITNGGYTVSIGENATWVSVGANRVLSHGRHYWEVVLEKYGQPSLSRKVVIGVVSSGFQQWHRCNIFTITSLDTVH